MSEAEANRRPAHKFTISFAGGGELPLEAADRIHKALHRAVLQEIADLDLSATRSAIGSSTLTSRRSGGRHRESGRRSSFRSCRIPA
jgi:hypothetical protein